MHLIFGEADLALMKKVRTAFDPLGLCNPGKIFPRLAAAWSRTGISALGQAVASRVDLAAGEQAPGHRRADRWPAGPNHAITVRAMRSTRWATSQRGVCQLSRSKQLPNTHTPGFGRERLLELGGYFVCADTNRIPRRGG